MRIAAVVAGCALAAGCLRTPPYSCERDDQCGAGTCEPTADGRRFCAAADDTCASHRRFGDSAAELAGSCAGAPPPAGRSPDACLAGAALPAASSSCAASVCAKEPSCCRASWSPLCVMEADAICGLPCGRQLALVGKGAIDVIADDDHDGTFTIVASGGAATQSYSAAQWADLDGDATPELLIGTANFADAGDEQSIDHFDGHALTTAVDLRTLDDGMGNVPLGRYTTVAISVGDTDRDGWADAAWIGTYPAFVLLHNRRNLQLEFGPEATTGPPDLVNPIGDAGGLADLDGDGDDDLAVVVDGAIDVLSSDGRALTGSAGPTLPGRPYWAGWGDVDGDGALDLAVAGNGFARVFRGTPAGLARTAVFSLDGPQLYGGAWTDLDGDGRLDLALSESDGKLRVHLNTGTTLDPVAAWSSLEDQEAPSIISADVDGDRRLDLVVANHAPYPPRIYLNHGDRSYDLAPLSVPAQSYEAVTATARTP